MRTYASLRFAAVLTFCFCLAAQAQPKQVFAWLIEKFDSGNAYTATLAKKQCSAVKNEK